jgi:hypothetical protein
MTSGTILLRASILIFIGLVLYAFSWGRSDTKRVRSWLLPVLGLTGWLFALVGALVFGETLSKLLLPFCYRDAPITVVIPVTLAALLVPIYAVALSTQFIENGFRLWRGLKPNKIEWIRGFKRRGKRKSRRTKRTPSTE